MQGGKRAEWGARAGGGVVSMNYEKKHCSLAV